MLSEVNSAFANKCKSFFFIINKITSFSPHLYFKGTIIFTPFLLWSKYSHSGVNNTAGTGRQSGRRVVRQNSLPCPMISVEVGIAIGPVCGVDVIVATVHQGVFNHGVHAFICDAHVLVVWVILPNHWKHVILCCHFVSVYYLIWV